jgi:phosphatidyl-myo-inositol alpha-mannosyltransferase
MRRPFPRILACTVRAADGRMPSAGPTRPSDRPSAMGVPENRPSRRRLGSFRRAGIVVAAILLAALLAFALSRLGLQRIGHALITATPGWVALAFVLMALSLLLRSISWQQTLRAALPKTRIPWAPVIRATMIGVMASALFPGRIGEPVRMLVLTRRLDGPSRRLLPVVVGTIFSQTLINVLALVILAGVTFTAAPLLHGHATGLASALALPLLVCALVLAGPRLLALGRRSGSARVARWANATTRGLNLARRGLAVFSRPRHGAPAVAAQLLAWTLQWLACYSIVLALGLQSRASLATAAAILLAVNLSAILPPTPANVGVFQAACLVVLAAYGVGAGPGLAYGIILQAVEVLTALALGVPALLGEGLTWRDIRSARDDPMPPELTDEGS